MDTPRTFSDLFAFYNDYVRLLYGAIQAQNALPQETLFEINAAFDHISRHWTKGVSEPKAVEDAFKHLKRSCLDIFKLILKDTIDNYSKLCRINTSIIDNGTFDQCMHKLVADIKARSVEARQADSGSHDSIEEAFALWADVYKMCAQFNKEFFLCPHIQWARRKNRIYATKAFLLSVAASFVAGLLLFQPLWNLVLKLKRLFVS
jgi:hypothetical protein